MNVYLLYAGGRFKVGISKDINSRIGSLQVGCPWPVQLIAISRCDSILQESARGIERKIHLEYAAFRVVGEWFSFDHAKVKELISRFHLTQVGTIPKIDNAVELIKPRRIKVRPVKKLKLFAIKGQKSEKVKFGNSWHARSVALKEQCETLYQQLYKEKAFDSLERFEQLSLILDEASQLPTCFWWQSRKHMDFMVRLEIASLRRAKSHTSE